MHPHVCEIIASLLTLWSFCTLMWQVLVMTYNHVVPGGAFIIDDWSGGQGIWESARKAVYDFAIHEVRFYCPLSDIVPVTPYVMRTVSSAQPFLCL